MKALIRLLAVLATDVDRSRRAAGLGDLDVSQNYREVETELDEFVERLVRLERGLAESQVVLEPVSLDPETREQIQAAVLDPDSASVVFQPVESEVATRQIPDAYLNHLADQIHADNVAAGWWSMGVGNRNKGEMIALMHSELSECLEGVRKGCRDDKLPHRSMEEVELADTIIRILDYAGAHGFDLDGAIAEKRAFNKTRADHKPENRAAAGGKSF